jgi:hypothetical protein
MVCVRRIVIYFHDMGGPGNIMLRSLRAAGAAVYGELSKICHKHNNERRRCDEALYRGGSSEGVLLGYLLSVVATLP